MGFFSLFNTRRSTSTSGRFRRDTRWKPAKATPPGVLTDTAFSEDGFVSAVTRETCELTGKKYKPYELKYITGDNFQIVVREFQKMYDLLDAAQKICLSFPRSTGLAPNGFTDPHPAYSDDLKAGKSYVGAEFHTLTPSGKKPKYVLTSQGVLERGNSVLNIRASFLPDGAAGKGFIVIFERGSMWKATFAIRNGTLAVTGARKTK